MFGVKVSVAAELAEGGLGVGLELASAQSWVMGWGGC